MIYLLSFFTFILGTAIGSFLNVVVLRGQKKKSIQGRSECPQCHHQLSTLDLIPVLSFFLLNGKCRYCKKGISIQYPLVELATGVLFSLDFLVWFGALNTASLALVPGLLQQSLGLISLLFFTSILIVISVYDIKYGIIPDRIVIPSSILALGFLVTESLLVLWSGVSYPVVLTQLGTTLLATFLLAGFFFLLIIGTRGKGMGLGDFKLSIFMGLIVPWYSLVVALFLAFLTGGIVGVMLILTGKKGLKQTIAFGPFLALGAYISLLFGKIIFESYWRLLSP